MSEVSNPNPNSTKQTFDEKVIQLIKQSKEFYNILKENNNQSFYSKLFYDCNNNYLYDPKYNLWYEYDEYNKLYGGKDKPPISLNFNITKHLQDLILSHKMIISREMPNTKEDIIEHKNILDLFIKCYNKLGDNNYKKGIIDELKYLCKKDDLSDILDNNKYLICFSDKVYDFKIGKFRNIEKSDFVFTNTGYNKPKENKEIQKKIINMISSCFDNEEIFKFVLDSISLSLIGNDNNKFYIWTGKGGNGKGLLNSLLTTALGDYFYQTSGSFLTCEFSDDKPNSNLYNLKNKKVAMISEPTKTKGRIKFNLEFLKLISSNNDKITVRKLYSEPVSFNPTFTPFLQCNLIPELGSVGDAELRRFCIVEFPFSFKSNPDPNKPNEKPVILEYSNYVKDKEYGGQFLLLLIENLYSLYRPSIYDNFNYKKIISIKEPKSVKDFTKEYLNENDVINNYLTEFIERTSNEKDKISKTDLYIHFQNIVKDFSISRNFFYKKLKEEGYEECKSGVSKYKNIRFIEKKEDKFLDSDSESEDDLTVSKTHKKMNSKNKTSNIITQLEI